MKLALAAVLALFAAPAAAHPTDQDALYNVGQDSLIELRRDVNVLPRTTHAALGDDGTGVSCRILMKEYSERDRVIRAGTRMTVLTADREVYGAHMTWETRLLVQSQSIAAIVCSRRQEKPGHHVSIGEFRAATRETVLLTLAAPIAVTELRPVEPPGYGRLRAALARLERESPWP